MERYIRPLKTGGYSECSCPDDMVGRGRCCHVLGEGGENSVMKINKIQRGFYEVEVNDLKINIQGQKEAIKEFFRSMPELNEEKIDRIIQFLNKEQ